MRGFDPEFKDLPDYILRITERIWEGRRPDLIRRYYTEDCFVRSPDHVVSGSEAVVTSTLEMLHQFPDRRLLGEDVIWWGHDAAGYFSSHRILSTMHHAGDGVFGEPTGRSVRVRTIADCAVRENRIFDEWLVRDRGAIARQIGLEPHNLAATLPSPDRDKPPSSWKPVLQDTPPAKLYAEAWREFWGHRNLATVAKTYHQAAVLELPGGQSGSGHADMDRFLIGFLASFPDCDFTVEHLVSRSDTGRPDRVAMRWTAVGTHSGRGAFGAPTGAPVEIIGINHACIVDDKIVSEWILVDEVSIWQQILDADAR